MASKEGNKRTKRKNESREESANKRPSIPSQTIKVEQDIPNNTGSFSNTTNVTEKSIECSDTENIFTHEYRKQVLQKLNEVLYTLKRIENRLDTLEDKMQHSNYCSQEEITIQLPITTFEELTIFEEQLKEVNFKNKAINTLNLVGGNTAHKMIHNILKIALTYNFAQHFSWAGKKNKKSFQDLGLARIITKAVRMTHKHASDAEIAATTSRWLAQAPARIERAKQPTKKDNGQSLQ